MARKKPQADNMKSKARKAAKAIVKKAVKKVATKSVKKASKKAAKKAVTKAVAKAVTKAAAKAPARKGAKKLAASTAKKARAGVSKAPAVKKVRAAKAARKAATRAAARKTTGKTTGKGAGKTTGKTARKTARTPTSKAVTSAAIKRRSAPRSSAGRRLVGRASPSRETLAKKTLAAGVAKKAATKSTRKPAKKRAVKTAATAAPLAVGKTARSRIVARQSKKLAPAVLRDGARRRVEKPTAPRPEKKPAAARRPPFRLHALGLRDEHATDRPAIEALLAAAYGRTDEAKTLADARADGRLLCALVAEYEGELIGYLGFVKAEPFAVLAAIAVAPQRQGKGVGSVLVSAGIETARAAGAQAVVAAADADWLLRFGFTPAPVLTKPHLALEIEPGALAGENGSRTPP
jgi:predicted N-acetyltransferase YhbS